MHGLSVVQNKEKDLSSRGEAARCAPRLKGLFCFLKTLQTPENTRFSCPQRVYHAYLLNALKRGFKRPPPTMPIRGLAGVKIKKEIAILFSQDYNFFLGFALVYRWNPLILGQFPCFFGIFHIKSLVWSIFLNYPENLQCPYSQHSWCWGWNGYRLNGLTDFERCSDFGTWRGKGEPRCCGSRHDRHGRQRTENRRSPF